MPAVSLHRHGTRHNGLKIGIVILRKLTPKVARFASAKAAMAVKIDGSAGTALQDQVIYANAVTVDESSTWSNLDKYSTGWGLYC